MSFNLDDRGEVERRGPAYELAFEEAGRALDAQERAVNELRSRASVLVAAAAITTSFFGGRALPAADFQAWAWIAITAFALIGLVVLAVLWPRHDWEFSASARDLIAEYVEPEHVSIELIHRDLALHRATSYVRNAAQLRSLYRAFRAGLLLLVVEVVSWVVALTQQT